MTAVDAYRSEVARRAHYHCEYCLYPEAASSTPLEVDHIIPEAKGGITTLNNLALCCRSCNLHKYVKINAADPITGETTSLFNPRGQHWRKHFTLDRDTGTIQGVTSVGRATEQAPMLNSLHAVATRRLLIQLGLFIVS
jgi:hypothetical protein